MASFSKKTAVAIIPAVLFVSLTIILSLFSSRVDQSASFRINISSAILCGYSAAIILAWPTLGAWGGSAVTALCLIVVLWFSLHERNSSFLIFAAVDIVSSVVGYMFYRAHDQAASSRNLRLERLGEDINILSHEEIEKKEAITALEKRLERYSTLEGVVESLSTLLSIDDITRHMIRKAKEIIGPEGRLLIFLVDTQRQALRLVTSAGEAPILTKTGDAFDRWILRNRKSLMIEDINKDFRFAASDVEEAKGIFRCLIAVPLLVEEKMMGLFRMDDVRENAYTQDDLRLLDIIANLGAVVIQNALLYSRTQDLAVKDGLTGLAIRRYFLERFQEEITRSAMRKGSLAILMLDIDNFKDYNDKYGHAVGDLVLKHLASTIGSKTKEGDIVARYGGEEIVVLLCGRNKKEAAAEAEQIRRLVKNEPLTLRRHTANITVSIGLASYPEDAAHGEELLKIADERLYKAKAAGRDKVCS